MSSIDDDSTNTIDINVPTDSDGHPLNWDGNPAKILGLLDETGKHYTRNGLFAELISDRAVSLSNGKTALEHLHSIPFVLCDITDTKTRTLSEPCPDIATRKKEIDDHRKLNKLAEVQWANVKPVHDIIVNPATVKKEKGKLLRSLAYVFGHSEQSADLLDDANGCGLTFIEALTSLAKLSTTADKAVVLSSFNRIKSEGIPGEVLLPSLKSYLIKYKRAKGDLEPSLRASLASPLAEVEMINLIAFKDASLRQLYELKASATPPTTLTEAVTIVQGILRTRVRAEELDQVTSGATEQLPVLAAKSEAKPDIAAALLALVAKLAPADTNKPIIDKKKKGGKDKDKDKDKKVNVPRNKDGKVLRWVDGMGPCKCGENHLYRDCTDPRFALPEKKESEHANGAEALDESTKAEVAKQIKAFMAGNLNMDDIAGLCDLEDIASVAGESDAWCAASSNSPTSQLTGPARSLTLPGHSPLADTLERGLPAAVGSVACGSGTVNSGEVGRVSRILNDSFRSHLVSVNTISHPKKSELRENATIVPKSHSCTGPYLSVHAGTRRGGNKNEPTVPLTKHVRPSASLGSVTSRSLRVTPAGSTKTDMAGSPTVSYPPGLNLPYRKALVTYQPTQTVNSSAEVTVNYPSKTLGDPRLEFDSPGPPRGDQRSGRPLAALSAAIEHRVSISPRDLHANTTNVSRDLPKPDKSQLSSVVGSLLFLAHPDSGCTGSVTNDRSRLVNARPCRDVFRAANGVRTRASCIGDMPVLALSESGTTVPITLKNVRCVPSFSYTLLSVGQMWKEQKISSRFDDVNALVVRLAGSCEVNAIPFAPTNKLPTIRLISTSVLDKVLPGFSRELAGATTSAPSASASRSPLVSLPAEHVPSSPAPAASTAKPPSTMPPTPPKPLPPALVTPPILAKHDDSGSRVGRVGTPASGANLPHRSEMIPPTTPSSVASSTSSKTTPSLPPPTPRSAARPTLPGASTPLTGGSLSGKAASPSLAPTPRRTAPPNGPSPLDRGLGAHEASGVHGVHGVTGELAPQPHDHTAIQPRASRQGVSTRHLGWHYVGTSSHVARLPAAQAGELLHRRSHAGDNKIRSFAHTTSDGPKVLASAPAPPPCVSCAQAGIKRTSHPGTLSAPPAEPGTLHYDLKELIVSFGGFRYIIFLIDEHTRYVFYDFLKLKSEVGSAIRRALAAFNATVGVGVDEQGRPLPKPRVKAVHGDREGGLMSHAFKEFCSTEYLHHTTSPPHDHDLNPIPERVIGHISERAASIKIHSGSSPRLWPWIIAYAIDWHNASITSVGSSTADAHISPFQRLTLKPPAIMDLASFGCRAVVLKPPTHQHKPSLSGRGWVGSFLGRSRYSKGSYDVLVDGNRVVTSSSVMVDEERFDMAAPDARHRPLASITHSPPAAAAASLPLPTGSPNVSLPLPCTRRRCLNLYSGPYARADGLTAAMRSAGWDVDQIDNDGEEGGGWAHSVLNDEAYARLLADARAGRWRVMMIAFPCSTSSIARFFDATSNDGGDRGPPIIRDYDNPDGLPENQIDPKHVRELRNSNKLLERTVELAIAARLSPSRTVIIFENPADRSPGASIASAPEFKTHGSIFRTTPFKRLIAEADMASRATFAYCRLGSEKQKYTTLYYTPEAGAVLDELDGPDFQCNHERGAHTKRAGGRGPNGEFISAEAAAYPFQLCAILTRAFNVAVAGTHVLADAAPATSAADAPPRVRSALEALDPTPNRGGVEREVILPTPSTAFREPAEASPAMGASRPSVAHQGRGTVAPTSPITFPELAERSRQLAPLTSDYGPGRPSYWHQTKGSVEGADGRPKRLTTARTQGINYSERAQASQAAQRSASLPLSVSPRTPPRPPRSQLGTVTEESPNVSPDFSPGGTGAGAYSPFDVSASTSSVMDAAVAAAIFDAQVLAPASDSELLPLTSWSRSSYCPQTPGRRLPGGYRAVEVDVAIAEAEASTENALASLAACVEHALRADSPDAPATHAEAMRLGEIWVQSEANELANHTRNQSWVTISRDELPQGRRVHKLIWVYKVKRDGTAKSRLCVQGTTLEANVDYQQVFSAALRHSSARALFAYAAKHGCSVRSVDLVAAYLQGSFVDGEVVYCHLPVGYPEYDEKGRPMLAKVQKPIYGIQQAGRRLQRLLFEWFKKKGFRPLDDSDPCIFTRKHASGEIITVGIYVDNLQIVHSAKLDATGRGPKGCAYNEFMDMLAKEWDVTDEGPMEDLLGIEVDYLPDGSIKLHQTAYVRKVVDRFMPDGPLSKSQRNSLPYSQEFLVHINDALSQESVEHPELVLPMQERLGCLMYATTATRPDIAYAVHQLCKCMHKPTPALMREVDHVLSYLSRTASMGLTYTREHAKLAGFADASWETRTSTSGWVITWQSAALSWGSRKQKSIALSTCEAEIIALSEAAKDVIYLRKLVKGLGDPETRPTPLSTDSKSARDVSYNPEHHDRMKHVERRHFYVRDMVESFKIEVPYVPTEQNPADFFTKPMKNASRFRELRKVVMNLPD